MKHLIHATPHFRHNKRTGAVTATGEGPRGRRRGWRGAPAELAAGGGAEHAQAGPGTLGSLKPRRLQSELKPRHS